MNEIEIKAVRAEPGGWRDLTFAASGYTPTRANVTRVLDRVLGAWPSAIAIIALLASMPALWLLGRLESESAQAMEPLVLYVAGCALLFIVVGGMYHARDAIAATVALAGWLALLALTLPLLVSRRYRAWVHRRLDPERPARGWIPASRIATTGVERHGDAVTVGVRFTDGTTVRYTARGADGEQLRRCFFRLGQLDRGPDPHAGSGQAPG